MSFQGGFTPPSCHSVTGHMPGSSDSFGIFESGATDPLRPSPPSLPADCTAGPHGRPGRGGSYRWRNCAPWSPPAMALKRHQHLDALGCWQPLSRWHAITACGAAPPPAGRSNGGEQTCLQPAKSRQSIRQALSRIEHSSIETQTIPKRKKIQKNNKSCLFYKKDL